MKVMKFGGGTVCDGTSLTAVGDVVEKAAEQDPVAVVLSAIRGVTDSLHQIIVDSLDDEGKIKGFVQLLKERHEVIIDEIVKPAELKEAVLAGLAEKIERLERAIYGISYTEEITPRMHDFIISYGERLSALILAAHLRSRGMDSASFDGDGLRLLTDGTYGKATPVLDVIEQNLRSDLLPRIKDGLVPVVTGYFGCAPDGSVTTFGRGGSDYSAAIIAYGLGADTIEVWKDVPGFMSADPKFVPAAVPIDVMTYNEAAELAYFGARVLHPRIVEPVMAREVPIVVKNLYQPDDAGTRITKTVNRSGWTVQSVASKKDVALVSLYGPSMAYTSGLASRVFDRLGEADINVYTMAASMASFSIIVDENQIERAVNVLEPLRNGIVHDIEAIRDVTLVCIVGEDLRNTQGIASRTFSAVANAGVNVELISDGGSDIALTFLIKQDDESKAIEALHRVFIEES